MTVEIRHLKAAHLTLGVMTMVPDEDKKDAQPGLDLIVESIKLTPFKSKH